MARKDLINFIKQSKANNNNFIDLSVKAITDKDLNDIIDELINFSEIILSRNMLKKLPNSFTKLKKLKKLTISENYFKYFPEEIIFLQNLEYLDLGANYITELPKDIGLLKNLKFLYLKGNPFKKFPDAIFNLEKLEILGLVNTKLFNIPQKICVLKNLKKLWIGKNRIKKLPQCLMKLKSLEQITLDENPLPIPKHLLENSKNPKELFSFYKKYKTEQLEKIYETKIVIIGESQAGKTSLLNRLIYDKFYEDEEKTENINIDDWIIHLKDDKIIKVNIWDFGGQDILYSLHKLFLTETCLFIVVWDARNENQSKKIEFWLSSIKKINKNPQILLVMNKMDEHISSINKVYYKQICPQIRFYNISCKYNWGIKELSNSIKDILYNNKELIYTYDKKLIELKKELKQITEPYITLEESNNIIKKYNLKLEPNYIRKVFVNLGIILWFKDSFRLNNYIILNINWFISNIYSIINWVSKKNKNGSFTFEDLKNIFCDNQVTYAIKIFFIDVLLNFEIIFEINKTLYFPNLLAYYDKDIHKETLKSFWKFKLLTKKNIDNYLFYKLIIRFNSINKITEFYKNVIKVKYDDTEVIIHNNENYEIFVYINKNTNEKNNIYDILYQIIKDFKYFLNIDDVDIEIFLPDKTSVSAMYLKILQKYGYTEYITIKSNKYKIDEIFYSFDKEKKMEIKIEQMYGDILSKNAVKNIINYNINQEEIIKNITELVTEIQKSNINNKNFIVENIQNHTKNPNKLRGYLNTLTNISSIPANVLNIIQTLLTLLK